MKELKKEIEDKTDFVVSWHAKKYNKVIFRVGNLNKDAKNFDEVSSRPLQR